MEGDCCCHDNRFPREREKIFCSRVFVFHFDLLHKMTK